MIAPLCSETATHYPMPMSRFGATPSGGNLWRIVFADSVTRLIGGRWPDGKEEYRQARAYAETGVKGWVLESWQSAMEHTLCTAEEYTIRFQQKDCKTTIQHEPYPYDGVYIMRHVFEGEPAGVDLLIAKANSERHMGFYERRRLRVEASEYREKNTRESERYRLRDAQPDPNGSMMIKKRRQINLSPAKAFKLPGQGFTQVRS
jgi:hypothetical protein